jgi:hypothetical protein
MKTRTITTFIVLYVWAFWGHAQLGIIAHYPLDGNANDISINALNGTIIGNPTPTTDRFGQSGSAMAFDGVDDHIDLGSSALLKPTAAVTLSLWAQNDNWSSFWNWAALAGNTSSGGYELVVHGATNVFESEVNRNSTYGVANYPLASLNSNWHHFALTYDGRYNILYVDGVAVDTDDAGANFPIHYSYPNNHTLIGAEAGTVGTEGDYFSGKIDDVQFYDRALSANEISDLFNGFVGINDPYELSVSINLFPNPAFQDLQLQVQSDAKQSAEILFWTLQERLFWMPVRPLCSPGAIPWTFNSANCQTGCTYAH